MATDKEREFAIHVIHRLREADFCALLAGGCVRDHLLGLEPNDFDVATDATPEEIRDVFGHRRTLAIGQAFGVITVLGPQGSGQIEVATFRRDATYSDGRHPDKVEFCDAEEDALRRDFTINGLFLDPVENRVIDYVGGRRDLQRRVLRAIGDPGQRIAEDKLRMLRAVRIAAIFDLAIDPATLEAVQRHASEIVAVSAERISSELRRMLTQPRRRHAAQLLRQTGLLASTLPELQGLAEQTASGPWEIILDILDQVESPNFAVAFAVLLRGRVPVAGGNDSPVSQLCRRLRLATREQKDLVFFLMHEEQVRQARSMPWPQLQRILIQEPAADLLSYATAVARVVDGGDEQLRFCREKLSLPADELDPAPLISGNDLKTLGIKSGPAYRPILEALRNAQLEGRVQDREQALQMARQMAEQGPSETNQITRSTDVGSQRCRSRQ